MKIFKKLLWFIVPFAAASALLAIILIVPGGSSDVPGFLSNANYYRLLFEDGTFLKALANSFALPLIVAVITCVIMMAVRFFTMRRIKNDLVNRLFFPVCFAVIFLAVYLTLVLISGVPPKNHRSYIYDNYAGVNIFDPVLILIAVIVGVFLCFLVWLADRFLPGGDTQK